MNNIYKDSERNANIIFDLELAYIKSLYDNGLVSEDDYVFMRDNALAAQDHATFEDANDSAKQLIEALEAMRAQIKNGW